MEREARKRAAPAKLGDYADADAALDEEKPAKRAKAKAQPAIKVNVVCPAPTVQLTKEEESLSGKYTQMRMLSSMIRGARGRDLRDSAKARDAEAEAAASAAFAAALRAQEAEQDEPKQLARPSIKRRPRGPT